MEEREAMALSTIRMRWMMGGSLVLVACADGQDFSDLERSGRDPSDLVNAPAARPEGSTDGSAAGGTQRPAWAELGVNGTLVAALEAGEIVDGATVQDFAGIVAGACANDPGTGTAYTCYHDAPDPALQSPALLTGVGDDPARFMRLAGVPVTGYDHNAITFPLTAPGAREDLLADFDFRITPLEGRGRADGLGFAFLNTALYPGAVVPPPPLAEEPSFLGSLGIGFDIYKGAAEGDIGNENVLSTFSDSISIHFDGQVLAQLDVEKITDLASGLWHHARVLLRQGMDGARVSIWLTPPCGQAQAVVEERAILGAPPFEARAWFGARSGGEAAQHDLANVRVQFMPAGASWVSLTSSEYVAEESAGSVSVRVRREGRLDTALSVDYATRGLSATAGADYAESIGTVTFAPGQAEQDIVIPLLDDAEDETSIAPAIGRGELVPDVSEAFELALTAVSAGGAIAGPALARVKIFDDEGARIHGHWGRPMCWHIIGMHTHVLPLTGTVLYWDRLGNVAEWDPASGESTLFDGPGHNLFCSGHAFLGDGELLIAGGHDDPQGGSVGHDGVGIADLGLFQPTHVAEEHPWHPLLPMNAPRWYPTVTTLSDGTALLFSGSLDIDYTKNLLPQVFEPDAVALRDLTAAMDPVPHGAQLYPWMFALPDARVVKVGPDADSWLLDTHGTGAWTAGPVRADGLVLDYGSAVLHGDQALIFGGGGADPLSTGPSNVVAQLDLRAVPLTWAPLPNLLIPRRQHNATLLPDGRVLVTGGSSAAGFSNRSGSATPAEMLDGGAWKMLPTAAAQRLYHSSAALLPDGSVVTAGGGEGAGATSIQSSAEIYYPDYWFKPRPTLTGAPLEVVYDQPFALASSSGIERVTLLRMSSVTHSFDQNQRFVEVAFTRNAGGVSASVPGDGWVPPGHYILFVLDAQGVPSVGSIVHVSGGAPL
jgi:galactose oxidase-like protein/Calx-beta domain-containing protein